MAGADISFFIPVPHFGQSVAVASEKLRSSSTRS
jgi:hypothetical protein